VGAAAAAAAVWLLAFPLPADAENFIEVYGGASLTLDEDIRGNATGPNVNLDFTLKGADFDEGVIVGGRAGLWFEQAPNWGVAVDVFYFTANIDGQRLAISASGTGTVGNFVTIGATATQAVIKTVDIDVFAVSWDVMGRVPLQVSDEFPRGRFQPYGLVGPALFIATAESAETDVTFGLKAGAGLKIWLTKQVGIFFEYRFTHFKPELTFSTNATDVKLDGDLSTHAVMAGGGIRF